MAAPPTSRPSTLTYPVLAVGVVAVSFAAIFIRLADAPALVIAAFRMSVAAVLLGPIVAVRYHPTLTSMSRRDLLLLVGSGLALALHFAAWIASLEYTSVASSVVLVTASPVFVALGSHFLLHERVTRQVAAGIALGLVGVAVVSGGDFTLGRRELLGDMLAVIGALAAGVYVLVGRELRRRLAVLPYAWPVYSIAAVALLVVALASGHTFLGYSGATFGWLVLLALVPQLLGHTSLNWVLAHISATLVAVAVMAEPVIATLLALLILSETPPASSLAGGVLVLAGVYLALRPSR